MIAPSKLALLGLAWLLAAPAARAASPPAPPPPKPDAGAPAPAGQTAKHPPKKRRPKRDVHEGDTDEYGMVYSR
ncbi:MAG TPA: hypothetical protein VHO06_22285 [Polyangia bacterium]|nr:hypothetical protein [Polyangia bacterium]